MKYRLKIIQDLFLKIKTSASLRNLKKRGWQQAHLSDSYCHYQYVKKKMAIYRVIFAVLSLLFVALALLLFHSRIYVEMPFGPIPAVKEGVIVLCVMLALPTCYLSAVLHPFDDLLRHLEKETYRRLYNYWRSTQLSHMPCETHYELLRRQAQQDAFDEVRRVLQRGHIERTKICALEIKHEEKELLLTELLSSLDKGMNSILACFKKRLFQSLNYKTDHHSIDMALTAARAVRIPDQTPSS